MGATPQSPRRSDAWSSLPPEVQARLAKRMEEARASLAAADGIPSRPRGVPTPLSSQQEQLWFLQQLEPAGTAYNQTLALRLTGRLDPALIRRCLSEIVRRHEILRTTIRTVDGVPLQEIHPATGVTLALEDVSSEQESDREAAAVALARQDLRRPFDLAADQPLRARLVKLGETEHRLFTTVHHIVFDGWSRAIFQDELAELYQAFHSGTPSPLPEPRLQYADYAYWQRSQLSLPRLEQVLAYWADALSGAPGALNLHTDHPRHRAATHAGARRSLQLAMELTERLRRLAVGNRVTLQMLLLAAFALLLYERTGQDDLVIGCPVTTRDRVDLESLIGFFVNTLPLRIQIPIRGSFSDLLHQVREVSLGGLEHREVPIHALVSRLRPARDLQRPTLFQVTLQVRNFPTFRGTSALEIQEAPIEPITAIYDLNLEGKEGPEGLLCWMIYNADLYDAATIDSLLQRLGEVLSAAAANLDERLSKLARAPWVSRPRAAEAGTAAIGLDRLLEASNLSKPQLALWTGQKLRPESSLYHVAFAFTLHGSIDPDRFAAAFRGLVEDSDAMRSVMEEHDGVPRWRVLPEADAGLEIVDLSGQPDPKGSAERWARERSRQPFDLSRRLFDAALLKVSTSCWMWYLCLHHIISDLGSMELAFRRVEERYRALQEGSPTRIGPFASHAERTARERRTVIPARQIEDDDRSSLGAATPLRPYGGPQAGGEIRAARLSLWLGPERTRRLRDLAGEAAAGSSARRMMGLVGGVLFSFLRRISGLRELTVAIPYHNRRTEEDRETMGLLMEILPIRLSIEPGESFRALAGRVGVEFERAVARRTSSIHNPIHARLYEVELNFATATFPSFCGLPVDTEWLDTGELDESLTLQAFDFSGCGDLCLRFAFNDAVFPEAQQRLAVAHFERMLDACLANPDQPIDQVDILSPEERGQIVVAVNRTERDYPRTTGLARLLAEQAAASAERIAVVDGETSLTYAQLEARAGAIAEELRGKGVGSGEIVGLCAAPSADMLAGFLGILKAGAAYLPLDPGHPQARTRLMLEATGARLVVAGPHADGRIPSEAVDILRLDDIPDRVGPVTPLSVTDAGPDGLAYVIFTSGSSGTPKAVAVPHGPLVNFGTWAVQELGLDPDDRVLQFASLNWDASLEEIVPCLLSGATLVLRAPAMTDSYGAFLRHCRSLAITVLTLPTSFWHGLTDEILRDGSGLPECVRLVNIGGEPVSARRVREWKSRVSASVRLVNTYGLTESTAVSTMCDLSRVALDEREPTAPIGHPIANCRAYVLNPMLQPVPDGVEGELCIAGACLARGYLNDPRLNAEKFVPDPFSSDPDARLLRTGDLVRRRPQVGLIHLGRMDEQVKVRGIRIEPAEIEACLCRHPAVRSAAVLVREVHDGGDHQLVAYVVPTTAERDSPIGPSLRQHLRERLPEYMVPSVFVPMDRLPLTSTGKTDRRALPAPRGAHLDEMPVEASPRNSLEMQLAAVWEATLGIRPVGIHDDFFELGGDSLLAVRLFSAIERTTGIRAPLALLFEAPTVSRLAGRIQRSEGQAEAGSLVAIQIGGSRLPLFCVHWLGGNVLVYRDLAIHLGPDQPVFGLQARGLGGSEPPHTRIEDMAQHYVKEILRRQPDGPYFLAGASMGGKVAFEMAQQLRAMGREVALVALFDTRGEMDPPSVPLESRVRLHAAQLRGRGAMDMALYLAKRVRARLRRAAIAVFIRAGLPLPRSLWDLKEITYRAARNYHPRFYPGRVILFRASERDPESDPFLGWDPVAGGGIAVHEVPGNHVTLLKEPGVRLLAEELRRRMAGSGAAGAED